MLLWVDGDFVGACNSVYLGRGAAAAGSEAWWIGDSAGFGADGTGVVEVEGPLGKWNLLRRLFGRGHVGGWRLLWATD